MGAWEGGREERGRWGWPAPGLDELEAQNLAVGDQNFATAGPQAID